MLRWLVDFSLRFRGVVITLSVVVLGYGVYTASRSQLDVFPEFAPPQVVIQTEAVGLSPEQVEQLVTRPIETAVNGVARLESIRSQSIQGLSIVAAVFAEGTNVFQARQMVSERLVEVASRIPQGVGPPAMAPLTSATSDVLQVGLTSERRSLMEIRTFADWTLRPRLLAVPGVAKIAVFGGEVRQLQIQVRPDRLIEFGASIDEVLDSARRATGVRGAGFVDTPNQRVVFRTEGQRLSPNQLGDVVLRHKDGRSVRLRDVAAIADRPEPMVGAAAIQGTPGVVLVVSSQYGAIIDVENILRRLRENHLRPDPRPVFQVVFDASLEVRSAVVYATFVVALVFLPVITMSGIQGRLFAPLGIAYILAILASLLVALTITPALCLALLPKRAQVDRTPRYVAFLKRR